MQIMTGRRIAGVLCCAGLLSPGWAQEIYTCQDAKGRRLTADRPIAECIDREQKKLSSSGTVKAKIGPALTAQEQAAEEAKAQKAMDERRRLADEKKRDRALVARYPDPASHDKERRSALVLQDEVIAAGNKLAGELQAERQRLDVELEFYRKDPSRIPPTLARQIDENARQTEAQKRYLANQELEKKRINERFDAEQAILKRLWGHPGPGAQSAKAAPAATNPAAAKP